jgi:hypothetical protein
VIDRAAARRFVQLHGRLLDRRRLDHLLGGTPAAAVVAAIRAYENPDGGFAGLLEPDVRTTSSQPIAVLNALELLHELGAEAPRATFDWLASISGPDGGIPFSLETVGDAPHAPWMAPALGSSFHMTSAVAAAALRMEASHPWVERASAFCQARLGRGEPLSAYETRYALAFLRALGDQAGWERLRATVPEDGRLPVQGGVEGETISILEPGREEIEQGQREDGGWDFDWLRWSEVAAFEWRARLTVDALVALTRVG